MDRYQCFAPGLNTDVRPLWVDCVERVYLYFLVAGDDHHK